jgi:hypothetical protein
MYTGSKLLVYRSVIDEENEEKCETKLWCKIDIPEKDRKSFNNIKQISVVPYQELEGVIKLYIATGVYPIMEIRIDDASYEKYQSTDPRTGVDVDNLINNRILPIYPVYIDRVVDGSLKTSQV